MKDLTTLEELKADRKDLHDLWNGMTKEQLLEEIWKEAIDAVNMAERVQLFMNKCTSVSKTNYTLKVIEGLIREKKQRDLSEFCCNLLDKEYNGDKRTFEDIVKDLKKEADGF